LGVLEVVVNLTSVPITEGKDILVDLIKTFDKLKIEDGTIRLAHPENITTALCHIAAYQHPSLKHRLDQFKTDYSLKQAELLKIESLKRRFAGFEIWHMQGILNRWYDNYQRSRDRYEEQLATAQIIDKVALRRDTWQRWTRLLQYNRQMEIVADSHYRSTLRSKYLNMIYLKMSIISQDRRTAKQVTVAKFLHRWRHYTSMNRNYHTLAVQTYNEDLAFRIYKEWRFQLQAVICDRQYNTVIATDALQGWIDKTQQAIDQLQFSEDASLRTCGQTMLSKWRGQHAALSERRNQADEIYGRELLRKHLSLWSNALVLSARLQPILHRSNQKTRTELLELWQYRTLQVLEAKRFRDFMLCHRVLRHWRLHTGYQKIVRRGNEAVVTERFHLWVLAERLELFVRYRNSLVSRNILVNWCERTRQSKRRNWALSKESVRYNDWKSKLNVLNVWLVKCRQISSMTAEADEIWQTHLLDNHFKSMVNAAFSIAYNYHDACEIDRKSLLRSLFSTWKQKTQTRKVDKIEELYGSAVEKVARAKKKMLLQIWIGRCNTVFFDEEKAATMEFQHGFKLIKGFFDVWRGLCLENASMSGKADDMRERWLISSKFATWVVHKQQIMQMTHEGLFMADVDAIDYQEEIFRRWRMRTFKVASTKRQADEYCSRLQSSRFRRVWRLWRAKTEDRRLARNDEVVANERPFTAGPTVAMSNPESVLQTPTRVRSKKFIPVTSVDRWRKIRASAGPPSMPQNRTNAPLPLRSPSGLRVEVFNNNNNDTR
jgi:hypothetical protein